MSQGTDSIEDAVQIIDSARLVPLLTRGATTQRLHGLWWASRPMPTPLRSRFGSAGEPRA